jgi:predicted NBD/HSP70 family sugar kinase
VVIPISRSLLAPHALLVAPPLVLNRDGAVDEVAKGLVLACLQLLAKAVVKASQELELLLMVGVGVVGGIPHRLHEVALVLSTLITPWVMVRNSCAFWTSSSPGRYCL